MLPITLLELLDELVSCESVTPYDNGAQKVLIKQLKRLGFCVYPQTFGKTTDRPIQNFYARYGKTGPNLCFAGHTDVVPPGSLEKWDNDPFQMKLKNGQVYGRGVADMKGALAAYVFAVARFLSKNPNFKGSLSFLITGDEEGPADFGTKKVLDWLEKQKEKLTACLIGEPTSSLYLGDMIKIGRRGSLNCKITVQGTQGHVAYPDLADNPIPRLLDFLRALTARTLDQGYEKFQPSNLEIVTIDTGNTASNVIPEQVTASFNIRFNPCHTGEELMRWIQVLANKYAQNFKLETKISAEPFYTGEGHLTQAVSKAVRKIIGQPPMLSTTGGTSDGRFIHNYCPVVECGLKNETAHKINETVSLKDLEQLTDIYEETLNRFFIETS